MYSQNNTKSNKYHNEKHYNKKEQQKSNKSKFGSLKKSKQLISLYLK